MCNINTKNVVRQNNRLLKLSFLLQMPAKWLSSSLRLNIYSNRRVTALSQKMPSFLSLLKLLRIKSNWPGTSLVAQWLRICLPMQGTQVWSLVWEDPTCWAPQLLSLCSRAHIPKQKKPPQWEACSLQLERSLRLLQPEKAPTQQQRPSAAKN